MGNAILIGHSFKSHEVDGSRNKMICSSVLLTLGALFLSTTVLAAQLTGLNIQGRTTIAPGVSNKYVAVAAYDDGSTQIVSPIWTDSWGNSKTQSSYYVGIVGVNPSATKKDSLTATYSENGITKSSIVSFTEVDTPTWTLTGLKVDGPVKAPMGQTTVYSAVAQYSDGQQAYVNAYWESNNGKSPRPGDFILSVGSFDPCKATLPITATYTENGTTQSASFTITQYDPSGAKVCSTTPTSSSTSSGTTGATSGSGTTQMVSSMPSDISSALSSPKISFSADQINSGELLTLTIQPVTGADSYIVLAVDGTKYTPVVKLTGKTTISTNPMLTGGVAVGGFSIAVVAVSGNSRSDYSNVVSVKIVDPTKNTAQTIQQADAERFFRWAEKVYSMLFFPATATTEVVQGGYKRTYTGSSPVNVLSVVNGRVLFRGTAGNAVFSADTDVGAFSDFLRQAQAAGY